jgi:plastocyanin
MKTLHTVTRTRMLWISLVLATIATLLLVACGETTQAQSTNPTSAPPAATATQGTAPTTQPTTGTAPAQVVQVKIVESNNQYSFQPSTITVPKGAQVVWTNNSDAPHTVTSDTNVFNTTSNLDQNATFKTIFATPGTYTYHCNIHPYMKGTITVTA